MPETFAYLKYFESLSGFEPVVVSSYESALKSAAEVIIVSYGLLPKWSGRPPILVADIPSRSTGQFRRIKDYLKIVLNHKPDIALFLNQYVEASKIARGGHLKLYRGMGFRSDLVQPRRESIEIEAIYSGSMQRPGVLSALNLLQEKGLNISIVGEERTFQAHPNIEFLGRRNIEETYGVYAKAGIGLNIVPDVEPFNYQDSTKLIEYCATGLKVVTSVYPWMLNFEEESNARFFRLNLSTTAEEIKDFDYVIPNVQDWAWERVLHNSKLAESILFVMKNKS